MRKRQKNLLLFFFRKGDFPYFAVQTGFCFA